MAVAKKRLDITKSLKETRAEVKKVTWPNRKELLQHTEVVITSILLVGAFIWVVDLLFGKGLNLFIAK